MANEKKLSPLEQFLKIFADIKAGEGLTVVLFIINVFLILAAYYILKTVRDALLIGGVELWGLEGDEIKAYLPAVMSILLLVIVPAYGALASKVNRLQLLKITMGFVIVCLLLLAGWGLAAGPGTGIGLTFYIWLGIVNVFLIAQFWSYANDVYTEAQGKRLFAVIAIGQSLGAILGPLIADLGSTFPLLFASAAVLAGCLVLYIVINQREAKRIAADPDDSNKAEEALSKDGGFGLVLRTRYLLLIALMILVTNLVNTTGEYILGAAAKGKSEAEASVLTVLGEEADARFKAEPLNTVVLSVESIEGAVAITAPAVVAGVRRRTVIDDALLGGAEFARLRKIEGDIAKIPSEALVGYVRLVVDRTATVAALDKQNDARLVAAFAASGADQTAVASNANATAAIGSAKAVLDRLYEGRKGLKALSDSERKQLKKKRVPIIKSFYARFFLIVNLVGLLIQMLLVSRIFKYFGVRAALYVLPVIAFGGYAAIGLLGGLLVLRVVKTAENATDYSLQNTIKQALFLPTSREAKYKAKAAIDTFFVRFGDAASAGLVAVGLHVLAFGAKEFAFVNVGLCVIWILLSRGIAAEHKKLSSDEPAVPKAKAKETVKTAKVEDSDK